MTIITKAINEKKSKNGDKLGQPLVLNAEVPVNGANADPEAQNTKNDFVVRQRYLILTRNALRPNALTTLCLFMTAVIVMATGIAGGICLYRLYARQQMHNINNMSRWYKIPYDSSNGMLLPIPLQQTRYPDSDQSINKDIENLLNLEKFVERNYFKERIEMDPDIGDYEKIDVPDFRGGRQGRFIHDFNMNKTGIIDIDGGVCFVMPLNRQRVLPPRNMYDLLKKMYNGYYEVDTEIVRETMKVITPAITDLSTVGTYISRECQDKQTYMLEPVTDNVFKRDTHDGVYGMFSGKNIVEIDIVNSDSVLDKKK